MAKEQEHWQILALEHDQASIDMADFFEKIWVNGIIRKKIPSYLSAGKEEVIKSIKDATNSLEGKVLTVYGSGFLHHYTYGLCYTIARKKSKDYDYVHVDNHSDSYDRKNGWLDCASFTRNILEEPEAKSVIYLGSVAEEKHTSVSQNVLVSKDMEKTLRKVLSANLYAQVYVSLDLDVLKRTDVSTAFHQGILELKHLLSIIEVVQEEKEVISADMLGYNGNKDAVSPLAYAAIAAKITGKDTKELEKLHEYFKKKYPLSLYHMNEPFKNEFKSAVRQLKI